MVNGRKQKNSIVKLVSEDGEIHRDKAGIEHVMVEYFQKLFQSEEEDMEPVLNCVHPKMRGSQC